MLGPVCPRPSSGEERGGRPGGQGRGLLTRISKSECLPAPTPAPGESPRASFACENGEVGQPGMKEKKIESRGKEIVEATREEENKNQGEKTQAPSLPQATLPPTMKASEPPQPRARSPPWGAGTVPSPGLMNTSPHL